MDADKEAEIEALAESLDCLTERQYMTLGNYTAGTVQAQRKRGVGPEYLIIGRTVLYPRPSLAKYLATKVRTRGREAGGSLL